jgi:ATP-dependent RNA helicase RhlE
MLDMGFIQPIRQIVAKVAQQRQTLLFSATMPPEIRQLANSLMRNPVSVQIAAKQATADNIDESVYFVEKANKSALLAHLVNNLPMPRAIVFTRTKHGADKVVRNLHLRGIRSEAIHGNKSQNARERALQNFRSNKLSVLVATDIASRGIDIDNISHVVNYDLTHEPETYVHRIGRTARAGASGAAVSFCGPDERSNLKAIEKLIRRPIPVKNDQPKYERAAPRTGEFSEQRHETSRPAESRHASPRHSEPRHATPAQRFDDSRRSHATPHPHPRHHAAPAPAHTRAGHNRPVAAHAQPASAKRPGRQQHPQHAPAGQAHNPHRRKPARRRRF